MKFKIKIFLFLLACFVLIENSYSQTSGYLGKRLNFGLGFGVYPVSAFTGNPLTMRGSVEYSIDRRSSLIAYYNYSDSKYSLESASYNGGNYEVKITPSGNAGDVTVRGFGFGYRKYLRGFVSPIGKYIGFSFGIPHAGLRHWKKGIIATISKDEISGSNKIVYSDNVPTTKSGFLLYNFQFTFGKIIGISNRVLFEYNIVTQYQNSIDGGFDSKVNNRGWDYAVFSSIYRQIRRREVISLNIGFKYLII